MVSNLTELADRLEDSLLALQDFGDDIYNNEKRSETTKSRSDRLFEIETQIDECLKYTEALRERFGEWQQKQLEDTESGTTKLQDADG